MKKQRHLPWFIIFFVLVAAWAILTDIANDHPLEVGLGIGIPVAIPNFRINKIPLSKTIYLD